MDGSRMNPPPFIDVRWCPVCGRDDRHTALNLGAGRHFSVGKKCDGAPQRVRYLLDDSAVLG